MISKALNQTKLLIIIIFSFLSTNLLSQELTVNKELDEKVSAFLNKQKDQWYDMNVPASDGKLLYDLIIKNNYKNAVEIGTSTGHSAIWMAWALSKTGGKLITIEIDKGRYNTAMANFKEAGLSNYIDARLADAHQLVPKLKGPIDFVFCDADKDWYNKYFMAIDKAIVPGGCYTAHNIPMKSWSKGIRDFLKNIEDKSNYTTTINNKGGGLSISYKK